MDYREHFSTKKTPQSEPMPGTDQVENWAGGYAWQIDPWQQLDRFLILGSEGGTYYASEHELTRENAQAVLDCINDDGPRVVGRTVLISTEGRAPKNTPALFVLAMCAGLGDQETRQRALSALPDVARIGTHLFQFAHFVEGFRGWGRGLRSAVARWYNDMDADRLAYQVTKYRQREGWSHRDLLRLSHPKPASEQHGAIYGYVTQGLDATTSALIGAVEEARTADSSRLIQLIHDHGLTREMVPTEALSDATVWAALFEQMPMTALIRNLGNLSKVGLLVQGASDCIQRVVDRVTDGDALATSRIHPLQVLAALNTYGGGHGFRGSGEWEVVPQVVDALDEAFYLAFRNVEPTGKRTVLALDVSGSMGGGEIAGVGGITPRVGASAMALVTARTESHYTIVAFSDGISELPISPRQRLDDVMRATERLPFGGTDCALPMRWAMDRLVEADAFVIYTDSETWCGDVHPVQALWNYRRTMGIPAKLVVVGMLSNPFSIADPADRGMLDCVGFSTDTPDVISSFIRGTL